MAQNNLFIIAGAEGSGKTTIISELEKILPFYWIQYLSTRALNEKGVQKITWEEFQDLAEKDQFALSFQKKDCRWGVTHQEIQKAKKSGLPIVWEVDLKFLDLVKNEYPEAVTVLTNGIGIEDLYQHFESGGQAVPAAMAMRASMSNTLNKMWHQAVDYIVENKKGESAKAAEEIKKIMENGKWKIEKS